MVVLMVGLPGTGKSKVAEAISIIFDATVLNRDHIRDAVFPEQYVDYSEEQNELVSRFTYEVADYILKRDRDVILILDGRPHSRRKQIEFVQDLARKNGHECKVIFCWAPDDIVRERLIRDAQRNPKMGAVRNFDKYLKIKETFDEVTVEHLKVDTSRPLLDVMKTVMEYLQS